MRPKAYVAPFWFLLGISLFLFLAQLLVAGLLNIGYTGIWAVIRSFMWPVILLGEAVVYWIIKKRSLERRWVWAHCIFILFAFVVWRFLSVIADFFFFYGSSSRGYSNFGGDMARIDFYVFWGSLIIAHLFFIMVLVNAFSNKENDPLPDDGSSGIFD